MASLGQCNEIEWSRGFVEGAPVDPVEPGTIDAFEGDIRLDVDCEGTGVAINTVTATIRPEDDNAKLTLGTPTTDGLVFRVGFTVANDAPDTIYGITVKVVLSDLRELFFPYSLPIYATRWRHA